MAEAVLVRPLAAVSRFLWGWFLGLVGLVFLGVNLVVLSWWAWPALDGHGVREGFEDLHVRGAILANAEAASVTLKEAGFRLDMTCRGACDDVAIHHDAVRPQAEAWDVAGRCVICRREARWAPIAKDEAELREAPGKKRWRAPWERRS